MDSGGSLTYDSLASPSGDSLPARAFAQRFHRQVLSCQANHDGSDPGCHWVPSVRSGVTSGHTSRPRASHVQRLQGSNTGNIDAASPGRHFADIVVLHIRPYHLVQAAYPANVRVGPVTSSFTVHRPSQQGGRTALWRHCPVTH
jgi:hypothetical protein